MQDVHNAMFSERKKEDVFFVDECNKEDIIKIDQAKQYCGECAVRDICLSFALKEGART